MGAIGMDQPFCNGQQKLCSGAPCQWVPLGWINHFAMDNRINIYQFHDGKGKIHIHRSFHRKEALAVTT
jgi:hypothetical protein